MIIKGMCPNCGGPISEGRLLKGLPCRRCLPDEYLSLVESNGLREVLGKIGHVKGLVDIFLLEDELKEFSEFFKRVLGKSLWSIQLAWARRMLSGESFALIAPTGVGKTTLLQTYALFCAVRGGRILYIVPTRELMKQVCMRLNEVCERCGIKVVITNSQNFRSATSSLINRIDVLTHAFLFRNKALFESVKYDLIIVDDFDALLKSSSLIDLLLNTLGVGREAIETARKIVSLKAELFFHKYAGNEGKVSEILAKLYEEEARLASAVNFKNVGQLLIASATGRARGSRVKVLRELLGFEVGSITDYLRRIVEVITPYSDEKLAGILKKLRGGTLIFVSRDLGLKYARELVKYLTEKGFNASLANSRKAVDKLRSGDVNILVGVATYYGILTRGLDEPLRIYNAVFVGIPKFEFDIKTLLENPRSLTKLICEAAKRGYEVSELEHELVRRITRLSPGKVKVLQAGIKGFVELNSYLGELAEKIRSVIPRIKNFIINYVRAHGKFVTDQYVIRKKGSRLVVQIPDVMTYIQASGRCSRLLKGRMTLGLSIIMYIDDDILNIFKRKIRNYVISFNPRELNEVDFNAVVKEQVRSRTAVEGGVDVNKIRSALIVVESPTKARTISRMFGRPGKRYLGDYVAYETVIAVNDVVYVATIAPTLGHVLDLTVSGGLHGIRKGAHGLTPMYTTIKRCADCGYQTTEEIDRCPRCGSIRVRDSSKVIHALRKLARESDVVFLATDPDDEGEKISYDVYLVLRPYVSSFRRVEFHEVTRHGFLKALLNPRRIDLRRVDAQIVRRVDDRLVGFELSSVLKDRLGRHWLGGGRVQTPVLEWVVSRYRRYVRGRGYLVIAVLPGGLKVRYFTKDGDVAERVARELRSGGVLVKVVGEFVKEQNPPPPYTTDTLLFDGIRKLRLSPGKVMRVAQSLFELGLITYHRTDSTHVSAAGIEIAGEYLREAGLEKLFKPRTWGGEGTHECIRPTKPVESVDDADPSGLALAGNLTWYHKRLYELIFRRFVASQMTPAKVKVKVLKAVLNGDIELTIEVPVKIVSEGFTRVLKPRIYSYYSGIRSETTLTAEVKVVRASDTALYTASDIIKLMKEKRIGRPSTYAKAVENNVRHGYIVTSKKRLYLIPTKLGVNVADLIMAHYPELANERATRELEALLEFVRTGKLDRRTALVLLLSDVVRIRVGHRLMLLNEIPASGSEALNATEA